MPTIRFYCVCCGTALRASSDWQDNLMECPSCTRNVPVPRLADVSGSSRNGPPVFPPEVLELSVKFLCTKCGRRLRTDARWEGRLIACPCCGAGTGVPRWSTVPIWPSSADGPEAPKPVSRSPVIPEGPILTAEEIDFLSEATSPRPGAAA